MDLKTGYLGLELKNPLIPSASPLARSVDNVKRMEDAGASAVVMYSLFEEQILHEKEELDHFLHFNNESFAEALSYLPEPDQFYNLDAEEYLEQIRRLKEAVDIPVIASLNGVSSGGWMKYAKKIEEAGADALELNTYYVAADPGITSTDVERLYLDNIKTVKNAVKIPVAIKTGPYFSAFANMAMKMDEVGADGLVLFNRFYQPDINLEKLEIVPNLLFSTSYDMRLPLRWIAILYGKVKASLAATSGIHTGTDAAKMILAGADVTMVASVLFKYGVERLSTILTELTEWMEKNEYDSIEQMRGSMSYETVGNPAAFARANYMKTLQSIQ